MTGCLFNYQEFCPCDAVRAAATRPTTLTAIFFKEKDPLDPTIQVKYFMIDYH